MSTIEVNKITPVSGGSAIQVGESGDTITVPSGATLTNSGTANGFPDNTPMWYAKSAANQTGIATATATKITYGTEVIDTDSAFASSKFTVPSGAAGKYFITGTITWLSGAWTSQQILYIYKNGSNAYAEFRYKDATDMGMTVSAVLDLAVSDYIEIYAYQPSGSSRDTWSSPYTFYGYKLGE
tara:strand:+ start:22 stop:570 length:549 start_codon:yes stop_codon:yes gene_type:complete